jgi:hypothetical protein
VKILGVYLYIDEAIILLDSPLDQISRSFNREGNATRFESYSQGGKNWALVEVGVVQGDKVHVVEHLSCVCVCVCVCVVQGDEVHAIEHISCVWVWAWMGGWGWVGGKGG